MKLNDLAIESEMESSEMKTTEGGWWYSSYSFSTSTRSGISMEEDDDQPSVYSYSTFSVVNPNI